MFGLKMPGPAEVFVFLSGWFAAGVLGGYFLHWRKRTDKMFEHADRAVREAQALVEGVYRVRLSCPFCAWESTVVRENYPLALEAGEEAINVHNATEGHPVSGRPQAGFWRGEPMN